jgi:hypothetical protein
VLGIRRLCVDIYGFISSIAAFLVYVTVDGNTNILVYDGLYGLITSYYFLPCKIRMSDVQCNVGSTMNVRVLYLGYRGMSVTAQSHNPA